MGVEASRLPMSAEWFLSQASSPVGVTPVKERPQASLLPISAEEFLAQAPSVAQPAQSGFFSGPGNPYLEAALQGATIGYSDEMQAAAKSAVEWTAAKAQGKPADFSEIYLRNRDAIRESLAAMEKEHPALAATANIAGGLATGYGALKSSQAPQALKHLLTAGSTGGVATRAAGLAASGAALGAAGGLGYSTAEDAQGLAVDAMKGAGLGAATGVAVPAVLGIVGAAARGTANAVGSVVRSEKTLASRKVMEALQRNQITLDDAVTAIREGGDNFMIADLGDNVTDLADAVARRPGEGRAIATAALTQRQEGQHGRITRALQKYLAADDDFYKSLDDLAKLRETQARPLYKQVVNESTLLPKEAVDKLLADDPRIAGVIAQVKKDPWLGVDPFPDGPVRPLASFPDESMAVWHQAKQALDSEIGKAYTAGDKFRASQMIAASKKMLALMDDSYQEYATARKVWAGSKSAEDALQAGRKAMNGDAELIASTVRAMPKSEQEFFVAGAFRALRDKIFNAPDTADAYKRVFNTQGSRDRIQAILDATLPPSQAKAAFSELEKTLRTEAKMYATQRIQGGSPTAPRLAASEDLMRDPGVLIDLSTGNFRGLASGVMRKMMASSDLPPEVNSEMARALFAKGPAAEAALTQMSQRVPVLSTIAAKTQPTRQQLAQALRATLAASAGGGP